jgi:glycerol-3-phosphate O-acyltransferase
MIVSQEAPLDDIAQAVLARDEVARYIRGAHGHADARERVVGYLDELRTTQRYPIYRALKHPLYPILRKIERLSENVGVAQRATQAGRVVYASNHKSHTDYLVEPLVLDDNGVRPPIMAAGINLFGGPLGLIHRHVTGALPIRRNTKDPAYLITLKAYVAELLQRHDLMFYPEGGRSYSGEIKPPKTGLINAALHADSTNLVLIPCAIAYDMILEDHILARQKVKRGQRPFSRELAEMVRYAVGYRSRAFVTFDDPIPLAGFDPHSRRDVLDLAHHTIRRIGRLVKVLPTSLVATALGPSIARGDLVNRVARLIDLLRAADANLEIDRAGEVVDHGIRALEARGIVLVEGGRFRVRERNTLRFYARAIEHLLPRAAGRTH